MNRQFNMRNAPENPALILQLLNIGNINFAFYSQSRRLRSLEQDFDFGVQFLNNYYYYLSSHLGIPLSTKILWQ